MIYYDSLIEEASIKSRMKFMERHKKRFSFQEIKGSMKAVAEGDELSKIVHKYFRKYGEEYEIKIITGKV